MPSTGTGTSTLDRTEIDPTTGEPRNAHIVKPKKGQTGAALVTEARVFGHEVEALCGHRFIPSKNPGDYPPCQECVRLFEQKTGQGDGWDEA